MSAITKHPHWWLTFLLCVSAGIGLWYYQWAFLPISVTPIRVLVIVLFLAFTPFALFNARVTVDWVLLGSATSFLAYLGFRTLVAGKTDWDQVFSQIQVIIFFYVTFFVVFAAAARNSGRQLCFVLTISALLWGALGIMTIYVTFLFGENVWELISHYELPRNRSLISAYRANHTMIPRLSGGVADPNLFAYGLTLPIFWNAALLLTRGDQRSVRLRRGFSLLLLGTLLILTLSRSGIIITTLGLIVLTSILRPDALFRGQFFGLILMGALAAQVAGWLVLGQNLFKLIWFRLSGSDLTSAIGEVRAVRMNAGFRAFTDSPFFGAGPGGVRSFLPTDPKYASEATSHSWFLDILGQYGIVGLILVLIFLALIIFRLVNAKDTKGHYLLALSVTWLGMVLLSQAIYSNFWHPIFASQLAVLAASSMSSIRRVVTV